MTVLETSNGIVKIPTTILYIYIIKRILNDIKFNKGKEY